MKTVSVSQLKAHLSRYLREIRRGGEIQVLDRGVPVARITQPGGSAARGSDDDRRRRLAGAGILRLGSGQIAKLLRAAPLQASSGLSEALRAERDDRV